MTEIANTLVGNCTEWQGARDRAGYGLLRHNGRVVRAHRLAYCEANGLELSDIAGMVVRHRCDNPSCVRPEHLELGSQADNVRDMRERGRAAKGEVHGSAKLTEEQVRAIREEYAPYCRERGGMALARKYGVSDVLIGFIVNRKIWAHI